MFCTSWFDALWTVFQGRNVLEFLVIAVQTVCRKWLLEMNKSTTKWLLEMMKHFFNFALIKFGKLNPFGPRLLFHTPAKVLDCVYLSKGGECKVFSMKKGGIRCIMVNGALTNWHHWYLCIFWTNCKSIIEYNRYYHLFGFFVVLNGTEGALGIPEFLPDYPLGI